MILSDRLSLGALTYVLYSDENTIVANFPPLTMRRAYTSAEALNKTWEWLRYGIGMLSLVWDGKSEGEIECKYILGK